MLIALSLLFKFFNNSASQCYLSNSSITEKCLTLPPDNGKYTEVLTCSCLKKNAYSRKSPILLSHFPIPMFGQMIFSAPCLPESEERDSFLPGRKICFPEKTGDNYVVMILFCIPLHSSSLNSINLEGLSLARSYKVLQGLTRNEKVCTTGDGCFSGCK